jgi:hypothetical protein
MAKRPLQKEKKEMRRIQFLMLLAVVSIAGLQLASAQNQGVTAPNSASSVTASQSNMPDNSAMGGGSVTTTVGSAHAAVMPNATTETQDKKNDEMHRTLRKDPQKGPYDSPRDWNFISEQSGG